MRPGKRPLGIQQPPVNQTNLLSVKIEVIRSQSLDPSFQRLFLQRYKGRGTGAAGVSALRQQQFRYRTALKLRLVQGIGQIADQVGYFRQPTADDNRFGVGGKDQRDQKIRHQIAPYAPCLRGLLLVSRSLTSTLSGHLLPDKALRQPGQTRTGNKRFGTGKAPTPALQYRLTMIIDQISRSGEMAELPPNRRKRRCQMAVNCKATANAGAKDKCRKRAFAPPCAKHRLRQRQGAEISDVSNLAPDRGHNIRRKRSVHRWQICRVSQPAVGPHQTRRRYTDRQLRAGPLVRPNDLARHSVNKVVVIFRRINPASVDTSPVLIEHLHLVLCASQINACGNHRPTPPKHNRIAKHS